MSVEYICDGCFQRAKGTPLGDKPHEWFARTDPGNFEANVPRRQLHACSRPCIEHIAAARGGTSVVLPF